MSASSWGQRAFRILTWILVLSFLVLSAAIVVMTAVPDRLLMVAECLAGAAIAARGLLRPSQPVAIAILTLLCVVTLAESQTPDGTAQAIALPTMASLILVATCRGRQFIAGVILAWAVGAVGISLSYLSGHRPGADTVDVPWVSTWYLIDVLSLTFLTLWRASDRWLGAIVDARDAQRKAELEELRFRRLFEQSPDGILVSDANMRILDANPAFCELLGYSVETLRSMAYEELLDPEEAAAFAEAKPRILATPDWTSQRKMRTSTGEFRFVELSAKPQPDGTRQITFRDVTARKAAEAQARQMVAAIEQADDIIRVDDPAGVIRYVNPAFERIWLLGGGGRRPEKRGAAPKQCPERVGLSRAGRGRGGGTALAGTPRQPPEGRRPGNPGSPRLASPRRPGPDGRARGSRPRRYP